MTDIADRLEAFASVWPTAYDSDRQNIALLREAAAEIGRLRGEVALAAGWHDEAPAMPNGVEDQWKAAVLDQLAWTHMDAPQGEAPESILRRIIKWHVDVAFDTGADVEALTSRRAADNRDAAGVDRSGITPVFRVCTAYESGVGKGMQGRDLDNPYKPDTDEHEAWAHGFAEGRERSGDTPAAAPAGEAVAWMVSDLRDHVVQVRRLAAADRKHGGPVTAEFLAARLDAAANRVEAAIAAYQARPPVAEAPVPVQAAPQEGEGYYLASFKHKANNGEVMWWKGDNAGYSPDLEQAGIYTELVPGYHDSEDTVPVPVAFLAGLRVRRAVDPGDSLNHMFWSAKTLRAAIQHRGDSQEVGRG